MLMRLIRLLGPAVIPSWRFFKTVGPSPRIAFRVGQGAWRPLDSTPDHLGVAHAAWRLVWNPDRNAQLYRLTCAERLLEGPAPVAEAAILRAVRAAAGAADGETVAFRVSLVAPVGDVLVEDPVGDVLVEEVCFQSGDWPARGGA